MTVGGRFEAAPWLRAGEARAAGRTNVLVIMTDQQPVSALEGYGNAGAKTPHVDRLCREGVRLDRFHVAAFPCSPSRACFFTGQYCHTQGVVQNGIVLRDDVPSMGKLFKAAGYQTAFVGKWHLGGNMHVPDEKEKWSSRKVPDPQKYKFEKDSPGAAGRTSRSAVSPTTSHGTGATAASPVPSTSCSLRKAGRHS